LQRHTCRTHPMRQHRMKHGRRMRLIRNGHSDVQLLVLLILNVRLRRQVGLRAHHAAQGRLTQQQLLVLLSRGT
jgi:hypothetical protein